MTIVGEASVVFKGKDEISTQLNKATGSGKAAGESLGDKIMGGLGGIMQKGTLAVGVAAGATLTKALFTGWNRLSAIEDAEAKLRGLGHSAKDVKDIMSDALKSVQGTSFSLGESATIAASAVAAGVKPGKQLESTLRLVADAATIGGTSLEDMGQIFNQVAASNKVQGDTIQQLQGRGIPILQLLGKSLGVTTAEVQEMSKKGQINFKDFSKAMQEGMGGAALKSGNTTSGAFRNMNTALARFGATLLSGVFPLAKRVFNGITVALDDMGKKIEPILANISKWLGDLFKPKNVSGLMTSLAPVMQGLKDFGTVIVDDIVPALAELWDAFGPIITVIGKIALGGAIAAFGILGKIFKESLGPGIKAVADALVFLKPVLLAIGVVISVWLIPQLILLGAAWIIGLGPIGWAVIAIIGLIAVIGVIKKNFPEIVEAVKKVGHAIADAFVGAWHAVQDAFSKFTGWFSGIWAGAVDIVKKYGLILLAALVPMIGIPILIIRHWTQITAFFGRLGQRIGGAVGNIWGKVKDKFLDFAAKARDFVVNFITAYVQFYARLPQRIYGAIGSLWARIGPRFMDLFASARGFVQDRIAGLAQLMGTLPGRMADALSGLAGAVRGAISRGLSGMRSAVMSAVSGAGSWLIGIGGSIISGLISGIEGAVNSGLKSAVQSIPGKIKSWKGPEPYDRQLLVPTGGWIMGGLVEGINKSLPNLHRALGDVTSVIGGTRGQLAADVNARRGTGTGGAGGHPRKVILRVGKREFDAYVEEIADERIDANDSLSWQGG